MTETPTYSEVYEHLMLVRRINRRIWIAQLEHDELQSCLLPKAVTYDQDAVQTSPGDRMGDIAGEVLDMEKKLRALQRRKATAFVQIRREIDLLDNEDQRDILVAFFLARRPMHAIADAQHLSLSSVYRIRKDAIQNLRVLLAKDLKSQEK